MCLQNRSDNLKGNCCSRSYLRGSNCQYFDALSTGNSYRKSRVIVLSQENVLPQIRIDRWITVKIHFSLSQYLFRPYRKQIPAFIIGWTMLQLKEKRGIGQYMLARWTEDFTVAGDRRSSKTLKSRSNEYVRTVIPSI